jgi:hypothetical protein
VLSKRTALLCAIPLTLAWVSGCGNVPGASTDQTPGAIASPQPAANQITSSGIAVGSPSPYAPAATLDVSPAQQRVGNISISLAFEPARHMLDQAMAFTTNVDPAQPTPSLPDTVSKGAIVLSDMLHVTNNMDPTQPVPPDSAQLVIRHAVLHISAGDSGQPIPYLGVTMDLLLDGHPVGFGQAIVPMVAADASTPSLYYGNNVRLGQRGMYQVFIRLSHNALLGNDQPQAAQFNVLVH